MLRALLCSCSLPRSFACSSNRRFRLRTLNSADRYGRLHSISFLVQQRTIHNLNISCSATMDNDDSFDVCTTTDADGVWADEFAKQTDMRLSDLQQLKGKEFEDPHQLRRRKELALLCKELPFLKLDLLLKGLDREGEWIRQEDATFIVLHCLRIHESEAGFVVYTWMMQRQWFKFDFNLANILVKCLGRQLNIAKCRVVFDHIINQGCVPSEATFCNLLVAYISAPIHGCLDEACSIYNKIIQLGRYQPRCSLHKELFRAIVRKPRRISKHYLKQAEFIFKNLVEGGHEVQEDIYGGLILLHSHQDDVCKERIASIREMMQKSGVREGDLVLLSLMRAFSKEGAVEEVEKAWEKLSKSELAVPAEAYECKLTVYGIAGEPTKALAMFREMQENLGTPGFSAYHKIIEVLSKARERQMAESIMTEFINTGVKTLTPSYINLLNMYFNMGLHEKLELVFYQCLELCSPNTSLYSIYLDSLVESGNLDKAENVFEKMHLSRSLTVDGKSCNIILRGYLNHGYYEKAEKMYDLMCQKGYAVDTSLVERLDYIPSLRRPHLKKPCSLKLSKEQREILVGLLLVGLRIGSDVERRNHTVYFDFCEKNSTHTSLRRYIHTLYYDWLHSPACNLDHDEVPHKFDTISHPYFGFYADQFWPNGQFMMPRLIHRWLSPRALAYWYMYSGYRLPTGDVLLKLNGGDDDGVKRVVVALKGMSLNFRMKKKGSWYWLALQRSNSTCFWKLIEPYILDDVRDILRTWNTNIHDGEIVDSPVSAIRSDVTKNIDL